MFPRQWLSPFTASQWDDFLWGALVKHFPKSIATGDWSFERTFNRHWQSLSRHGLRIIDVFEKLEVRNLDSEHSTLEYSCGDSHRLQSPSRVTFQSTISPQATQNVNKRHPYQRLAKKWECHLVRWQSTSCEIKATVINKNYYCK